MLVFIQHARDKTCTQRRTQVCTSPQRVCVGETEIPHTYSARVRHVTSTWAVIIRAGTGSASIRAVRHMAETHVCTQAHLRMHGRSLKRGSLQRVAPLTVKSRVAGAHPRGCGTYTFLVDWESRRATPWCAGMTHGFRVMSASP